jgi:hypothetical protein
MSGSDDLNARRARLMAMREKYQRSAELDDAGSDEWDDADLGESEHPAGRAGGGRGARGGRRGGRGGGQGASIQKVLQFLTQPGPGGKTIPGTSIKEDRLKQAVQFLRHRSQMAEGTRGKRLKRLLQYLGQENPGDMMVSGVNVARLKNLIGILEKRGPGGMQGGGAGLLGRRRAGARGRNRMGGMGEDELEQALVDELEEDEEIGVEETEKSEAPSANIESTLQQLVGITHRLSAQLEETQRQVDEIAREKAQRLDAASHAEETSDADSDSDAQPNKGKDWFTEYLE